MKYVVVLLTFLLITTHANVTFSAPSSPDILGIYLGMTQDEAEAALRRADLPHLHIDKVIKPMTFGSFTSQPILIGLKAETNPPSGTPDDEITVLFDATSTKKVIAVRRKQKFYNGTKPSVSVLHKSISEKYVLIDKDFERNFFTKFAGSSLTSIQISSCIANLDLVFSMYGQMIPDKAILAKCGTVISGLYVPDISNESVAIELDISVVDMSAAMSAWDSAQTFLHDSNEKLLDDEKQRGDAVRVKL